MQRNRNQNFSLLIGYEQEMKRKIQQTQNLVMDNRKDQQTLKTLNELIREEQKLLKCLEVQSCQMQTQLRTLYAKNIQRFKKKINQHKDYVNAYFGNNSYQSSNQYDFKKTALIENQNLQLQTNKMTMYENEQIQNVMGYNISMQGKMLSAGFEDHRKIRQQAEQAQGAIELIQKAIFRRKFMFFSLIVLLIIAVVIVVIRKVNKVVELVS